MKQVTFVIGLPGSGKTTLFETLRQDSAQRGLDKIISYEDWMRWSQFDENVEFTEDDRYKELIYNLENKEDYNNVYIVSCAFCRHEFLCKSEYYLQSLFPNLKISRIYFENNLNKAITNIIYRDISIGGKWAQVNKEEFVYNGDHHNGERVYEYLIRNASMLSKNYIIPSRYRVYPIQEMDGPKNSQEYLNFCLKDK